MFKTPGIPVKTRLPLTAWVLAGLVVLFSLVSSLVRVTAAPELTVSVADQATPSKAVHRADGTLLDLVGVQL
jgi:hypothetical protein